MSNTTSTKEEHYVAIAALAAGAIVSAALSPFDIYFMPNFLFFWGSHLALIVPVYILSRIFKLRLAALAGIACALTVYLLIFGVRLRLNPSHDDALAWIAYVLSLPGGAIGAIISLLWIRKQSQRKLATALAVTFGITGLFLFINQMIICNSMMHCGCLSVIDLPASLIHLRPILR